MRWILSIIQPCCAAIRIEEILAFTPAECEQPSIKLPALSSPSPASIINKCHDTHGQRMENTLSTCPEGFYVIKPGD